MASIHNIPLSEIYKAAASRLTSYLYKSLLSQYSIKSSCRFQKGFASVITEFSRALILPLPQALLLASFTRLSSAEPHRFCPLHFTQEASSACRSPKPVGECNTIDKCTVYTRVSCSQDLKTAVPHFAANCYSAHGAAKWLFLLCILSSTYSVAPIVTE